ncbi:MAG: sulfotransferase [Actinomycetota bacterium]|nr:sulfotransferase [Actinomycetota bacterium]
MPKHRNLPQLDFVVIGAYKAATTSLHLALRAHPQVFVPERKEPSFFAFEGLDAAEIADNPISTIAVTDPDEYVRLFEARAAEPVAGEVSPEYLKNPRCAERLRSAYPEARMVAILRDPAQRAHSDYLMYRRDGREPADTFSKALDLQPQRHSDGAATGQYLITGMYGRQLQLYYERFSADRILVLRQDELATDRVSVMDRLAIFLEVDPAGFIDAPTESNRSGVPTSLVSRLGYAARRRARFARRLIPAGVKQAAEARLQSTLDRPELEAADRARLVEYYATDVELTEELTGLDLASWRTT